MIAGATAVRVAIAEHYQTKVYGVFVEQYVSL
jgi:hypothetical protein